MTRTIPVDDRSLDVTAWAHVFAAGDRCSWASAVDVAQRQARAHVWVEAVELGARAWRVAWGRA